MIEIENHIIEEAIVTEIEKLKKMSSVDVEAQINKECKPGAIGIRSQVLVTIMGVLEESLEIIIPNNCYIFRDSNENRELTIKEAAAKLIKIAKHAK